MPVEEISSGLLSHLISVLCLINGKAIQIKIEWHSYRLHFPATARDNWPELRQAWRVPHSLLQCLHELKYLQLILSLVGGQKN